MRSIFMITFFVFSLVSVPLMGANYYVDTTSDTTTCTANGCSLRGAIINANASPSDDHIYFSITGTFLLTLTSGFTDEDYGDLDIADNGSLTIHGISADMTQIDAGGEEGVWDRVIEVETDADVVINNVTIRGGYLPTCSNDKGGGVLSFGKLVIFNSTIKENEAYADGGGVFQYENTLLIKNSVIKGNIAGAGGGAGLYNTTATIIETSINDNETTNANGYCEKGGAINSSLSNLTLIACNIDNNQALNGGGMFLSSSSAVTVSINGSTISNNDASSNGAGIYLSGDVGLEINDSAIHSNLGDGIFAYILSGNSASLDIYKTSINDNGKYAGVCLISYGSFDAYINRSVIYNNSGSYGGIYSRYLDDLVILNTTVSGNTGLLNGGGIYVYATNGKMISSTIADNSSSGIGGGFYIHDMTDYTVFTLKNSIIADNSAASWGPDCFTDNSGTGTYTFSSDNGNIIGDSTDCSNFNDLATDQLDVNPGLFPLTDNGGATLTHAIDITSPAYNQIPLPGCKNDIGGSGNLLIFDQRGYTRPAAGSCDVGAFELE